MSLLLENLKGSASLKEILKGVSGEKKNQAVFGIPDNSLGVFLSFLNKEAKANLILVESLQEAENLKASMGNFSGKYIEVFPPKEILPYKIYAKSNERTRQRIKTLYALDRGEIDVLITTGEALLQKLPPKSVLTKNWLEVALGDVQEPDDLLEILVDLGYEFSDLVEGPGQFSKRGGIIDVFPPIYENPIRIEFFGDEIDSLRSFDINNQRSIEVLKKIILVPAREFLLNQETRSLGAKILEKELEKGLKILADKVTSAVKEKLEGNIKEDIATLREGNFSDSLERWQHLYYKEQNSLLEYFADKPNIFINNLKRVIDGVEKEEVIRDENFFDCFSEGITLQIQKDIYYKSSMLEDMLEGYSKVSFSCLPGKQGKKPLDEIINMDVRAIPVYLGKIDLFLSDLNIWQKENKKVVVALGNEKRREFFLNELLQKNKRIIQPQTVEEILPGEISLVPDNLIKGFEFPEINLVVIGEEDLYSSSIAAKKVQKARKKSRISSFTELREGDYIVHVNHGIGRYLGIINMEAAGVRRDYLQLEYGHGDKLYIPADQVDMLEKYIGAEGRAPKLSRLGTKDWENTKSKVRKSVKDIAEKLLKLYAERQMAVGYAFSPDTPWQKEFEDSFPYKETEDQLKVIEDIKKDMEALKPMDRVVIGDVGYGKTEVALRAAFKAVMDSKQVAVLVPTTVLASQHYETFKKRFERWPITIEVLNRFKSPKEQKKILDRVLLGEVDVLIGTHRLLSKDVRFNNLGLVIVDEEQKFGVTHKEKLKEMRKNVDFLTLTATPIPRTLHLALSGARNMSIIDTPPEDRFPVQSYVLEENPEIIERAIKKELDRNGQIFYIHNRINELEAVGRKIKKLVPEIKMVIAHGQMEEKSLEESIIQFVNGEAELLLCTTLIESGIDIANANTLIVENSDHLGLAQIYQLKGRIGRSNRMAYAYFTYRKGKILNEQAEKRLKAIREYTEFGSGFKIAMRDLEIRGAGNLLGAEQHGHMMTVGFDLYCQLLEEEMSKLKGEEKPYKKEKEIPIELEVNAFIDGTYVKDLGTKMDFYQRLLRVESEQEVLDIADELIDRFGDPPKETRNLILLARLKALAREAYLSFVDKEKGMVRLVFEGIPYSAETLGLLGNGYGRDILFSFQKNLEIKLRVKDKNEEEILKDLVSILGKLKNQAAAI